MNIVHNRIDKDLSSYKDFLNDKEYLINTKVKNEINHSFYLLYHLTIIIEDFCKIKRNDEPKVFLSEVKSDLIVIFDLMNMKYFKAARILLRSSIEQTIRFSLSIQRIKEYNTNKNKGIFGTTESLRKLRSSIDTHRTGRMTAFASDKFANTLIKTSIENLLDSYSYLSNYVHVNTQEHITIQNYLEDYNTVNNEEVIPFINLFNITINDIITIIYFFYISMALEGRLSKRDWLYTFEMLQPEHKEMIQLIEHSDLKSL